MNETSIDPSAVPLASQPNGGVQVERFQGDAAEWDALARGWPGSTHCHRHAWGDVMERVFGHAPHRLVARDGAGRITGLLPLVSVRSLIFGRYLVSMPFLNYGGTLGDDRSARALAEEALRMSREGRVKLLELRSRREIDLPLAVSHRKVTMLLDLPGESATLWKAFTPKLRSQIRRPQKEGLTVRFGPTEVGAFYGVFARHMRDLGTPVMPRAFFDEIVRTFPDDTMVATVYAGELPVAAGLGFVWQGEFEITWASSLLSHKQVAPNMLLYWAMMERCIEQGIGVFNFGRTTPGSGTHRFKQQWGTREEQLWWYGASDRDGATTPAPTDSAYAWGPRIWKKLPLAVASVLGPRVVRGIP